MCGIFIYTGPKNATQQTLTGLKRLEYRGYDSWGVAVLNNTLKIHKQTGPLPELSKLPKLTKSQTALGHTRWATHGGVTKTNAHPHFSTDQSFALVHNGIVQNSDTLKAKLEKKGWPFHTQTDTEVIARLIEQYLLKPTKHKHLAIHPSPQPITYNFKKLLKATRQAAQELDGRNTFAIITKNGELIASRNGSPLVLGLTNNKEELYISSDTLSFAPQAKDMIVVEDGQLVSWSQNKLSISDLKTGKEIQKNIEKIEIKSALVDKAGYDHFMVKEISDTPKVLRTVANQPMEPLKKLAKEIKNARQVYTIGSGTTGIAASQMAFYLRKFANIPAVNLVGAESTSYFSLLNSQDLMIAPSQSGETADVLEVLELAKKKGVTLATYVNMPGSTMTRMSDFPFFIQAGPEICVMSTKVFVAKLAWGYLLAQTVDGNGVKAQDQLKKLADNIQTYLSQNENHHTIKTLAKELSQTRDIFLLGKGQNLAIVQEGMVKIIEGSYKHAHAIPAGDLKHYAITIVEKGVPIIFAISDDETKSDVINAVNEVKTRGATTIGVGPASMEPHFDHYLNVPETGPTSAIMNIIPLQLLAYYLAVELGTNVDKPRNIAKSVTVK